MSPLIELRNIVKTYIVGGEALNALNDVSLSIEAGEYLAIMGTSGSGKSTLMNIIGCLDKPSSGEYILNRRAVQDCSEDELARLRNETIGFVFQQFNLLPRMTALRNVMLPQTYGGVSKEKRQARAEEVLALVGLKDRMLHKPTQLSGGQQQRVSIARALSNHPKILLADEPTGNLDSNMAKEIMALFDKLVAEGMTVILVTHDAETANHAQRIIWLKDGKITSITRKDEPKTLQ
ncbi:MAG: ABC transporter ATP-binding protein [Candidatus Obscuribacterales bacterium]|nr:ABC transporter ATP-binding protein [Candidatus Obscuribacterales bacterium]